MELPCFNDDWVYHNRTGNPVLKEVPADAIIFRGIIENGP